MRGYNWASKKDPPTAWFALVQTEAGPDSLPVEVAAETVATLALKLCPSLTRLAMRWANFRSTMAKKAAVGMPRQEYKEGGIPLYGGDMGIIPGRFHDEPVEQPFAKFSPNRKFVGDEAPKRMRSSSSSGQFGRGRNANSNSNNAGRRYHVNRAM